MLPIRNRPRIPVLHRSDKNHIVERIRAGYRNWATQSPNIEQAMHHAADCFWISCYGSMVLTEILKTRVAVTAGSASWPRIRLPLADDGKIATHFSYIFEPGSPQSLRALAEGAMPEMHCWISIPSRGELVDLTTRNLKEQCNRIMGAGTWQADDPPDYIWCRPEDLPKRTVYQTLSAAVAIAKAMSEGVFGIKL